MIDVLTASITVYGITSEYHLSSPCLDGKYVYGIASHLSISVSRALCVRGV